MASLVIRTGPRKGSRLVLLADKTFLGRETGCNVVIDETMLGRAASRSGTVSRWHAVISRVDGHFVVEDGDGREIKSRNGVYVNEQKIPFPGKIRLRNNDLIRLCDFSCTFHEDREVDFSVETTLSRDSSLPSLQAQPAEKLRVILEISNSLSATLDMDFLLARLVEKLLQLFSQADRCFLILRDEAKGSLELRAFQARQPSQAADNRFSTSIVWRCLDNVEAILCNNPPEQFPGCDSVTILPVSSLVCAPLWSPDGQALGAIQLDTAGMKTKFTHEDLNLLLGVAYQASIALCNARFHQDALNHQRRQQELDTARQVLLALLPQGMPDVPGYEFYAYYESAHEIGGDYYDFIPLPNQRLAVLLGDVAGKGVAAALIMVKFSVEARVCLERENDLATAVRKLNTLMHRPALMDRFVTLVAMILDPATHTVTLVNAGHPSPLLTRHTTRMVEEAAPLAVSGQPIGLDPDYPYTVCQTELLPGDGLFLFSDGVTEAMNAQEQCFGPKSVRAVLKRERGSQRETAEQLIQAVKRHAFGCSQNDDITLVCFGRSCGLPS